MKQQRRKLKGDNMKANVEEVVVKQTPGEPEVPAEVLAQSIVRLDEAVKKMTASGLRQRAIILLLHDHSGVGKPAVRQVLESLSQLRQVYTNR